MDYAFQAMKKVRAGTSLTAEGGLERFTASVRQVWRKVSGETAVVLASNAELQSVYQCMLGQAMDAWTDLRWLGKPEAVVSEASGADGSESRGHGLWRHARDRSAGKAPHETVKVRQRVDLTAAWESLERAAHLVDEHAAALYTRVTERAEQTAEAVDGLALGKALLNWDCQKGQAPEEVREELRRYFQSKGIEVVYYSPERSALFQMMPANSTQTLEPALVRKVKTVRNGVVKEEEQILQRGLACVEQEAL